MRCWISFVLLFLFSASLVSAEIYFTEVMYNPLGSDTGYEWVEVYSNETLDLTSCKLFEANVNHNIALTSGDNCSGYCIIADNTNNFLSANAYNGTFYDSAFSLSNSGESLALICDGTVADNITYSDTAVEGQSLQRYNNTWVAGDATPGSVYVKSESIPADNQTEIVQTDKNNTTIPGQSTITIDKIYLNSNNATKFGDLLDVKFTVHKGDTSKYAVYLWVDGLSDKSQANFYTKNTDYTMMLQVFVKPNCKGSYDEGLHVLRISGLGIEVNRTINVSGQNTKVCQTVEKTVEKTVTAKCESSSTGSAKSFEYSIQSFPSVVTVDEEFYSKVRIVNNYDHDIPIKVWSYVYRGSKSYSGERELNLKEFTLSEGKEKVIELSNTVTDAEPGQYKLKVLINKNGEKTNKELIEEIVVVAGSRADESDSNSVQLSASSSKCPVCKCDSTSSAAKTSNKVPIAEMIAGNAVIDEPAYESDTVDQKKMVPVMLGFVSLLGAGLFKRPKADF
jgi:hypothetical protein